MAYLLMIVEPRGQREARTAAEGQAAHDAMTRFAGDLAERGVLRAAYADLEIVHYAEGWFGDRALARLVARRPG